jgi:hypothetical protein
MPDWAALTWAKENCPSYITNIGRPDNLDPNNSSIVYYFGDEREALMFMLKWDGMQKAL